MLLWTAISFSIYSIMLKKWQGLFHNRDHLHHDRDRLYLLQCESIARHVINRTLSSFFVPLAEPGFIIAFSYLGILSSLVTSLLTNYTLSKIDAYKMCVFINLNTVISIIAGVVFLKENFYCYHAIGSVMIISGVVGTNCLSGRNIKK